MADKTKAADEAKTTDDTTLPVDETTFRADEMRGDTPAEQSSVNGPGPYATWPPIPEGEDEDDPKHYVKIQYTGPRQHGEQIDQVHPKSGRDYHFKLWEPTAVHRKDAEHFLKHDALSFEKEK